MPVTPTAPPGLANGWPWLPAKPWQSPETRVEYVIPASTGVIGVELDPALLIAPVPKLVETLAADSFEIVADSILTTDLRVKTASEEVQFQDGVVRVAA